MTTLIAVDLDDCLLEVGGAVHPDVIDALDELEHAGIAWCVATGRSAGRLKRLRQILKPTAGWIWAHGARTEFYDFHRAHTLPKDATMELMGLIDTTCPDAHVAVDAGEAIFHDAEYPLPKRPGRKALTVDRGTMALTGGDLIRIHSANIAKLVIDIEEQSLPFQVWDVGPDTYCEITASTATKLSALGMLALHHGIKYRDIAAIGDGHTDAAMLEWAGLGITFTDAHHQAIAAADVIIGTGKIASARGARFLEALAIAAAHLQP